jgi:hypothetical protein
MTKVTLPTVGFGKGATVCEAHAIDQASKTQRTPVLMLIVFFCNNIKGACSNITILNQIQIFKDVSSVTP